MEEAMAVFGEDDGSGGSVLKRGPSHTLLG